MSIPQYWSRQQEPVLSINDNTPSFYRALIAVSSNPTIDMKKINLCRRWQVDGVQRVMARRRPKQWKN